MQKTLNTIKKYLPKKFFKAIQPAYHFILSWLAALAYHRPSEKLIVIGVTGTTGKTTIVYLIAQMLKNAGYKVGYTSTAMFDNGEKEWLNDKKMTMVGRFFTQSILKSMVKNGCQYAIIETTSEGVRQFRHRFINYDILVFSGLYPEHIESHGSFEKYKEAKGKLFAHLKSCKTKYAHDNKCVNCNLSSLKKIELNRVKKTIIVNLDDEHTEYFLDFWAEEKIGFSRQRVGIETKQPELNNLKIVKYSDIEASEKGINFKISKAKINLQLLGAFNATNAMAAYCVGESQEIASDKIKSGLEKITGIPGRLEKIAAGQNFTVIVDYAFEPKAVEKLYETVALIPHERIIHVLGSAGGGRDMARRPKLGEIAGSQADFVIVTNEDPYDENPEVIMAQVAAGAENKKKIKDENLFQILDRREAIEKAFTLAHENDIVLITGKGSEQAICVADGEKIPWDDRQVARELLIIDR